VRLEKGKVALHPNSLSSLVLFIGEFSPNFDMKIMISTSGSDFSWQNWKNFEGIFFFKSPNFCDKF
jgi:hypothetical protein